MEQTKLDINHHLYSLFVFYKDAKEDALEQWLSTFPTLPPFTTALHSVVTPTIKLSSFATSQLQFYYCYESYYKCLCLLMVLDDPCGRVIHSQRGCAPQVDRTLN